MTPLITREDAARIAALAKLEMSDAELERAARELCAILEHFAALDAIDLSGVDAAASDPSAAAPAPALRADEPAPSLSPSDAFANAPDADRAAGLFRVPRVLGS